MCKINHNTHVLDLFLARWWASKPSESVCKLQGSTSVRLLSPPNHMTTTLSSHTCVTLPGQAGQPLAGPHTKSPVTKLCGLFKSDFPLSKQLINNQLRAWVKHLGQIYSFCNKLFRKIHAHKLFLQVLFKKWLSQKISKRNIYFTRPYVGIIFPDEVNRER